MTKEIYKSLKEKILIIVLLVLSCFILICSGCSSEIITYSDMDYYYVVGESGGYEARFSATFINETDEEYKNIQIILVLSNDGNLAEKSFVIESLEGHQELDVHKKFEIDNTDWELERIECEIEGYRPFEVEEEDWIMPAFIIIAIIIIAVFGYLRGKKEEKNTTNKQQKKDYSKLMHKECDTNIGDACLHIESTTETDIKACKNCGYVNDPKAKRCSVCGKKLW